MRVPLQDVLGCQTKWHFQSQTCKCYRSVALARKEILEGIHPARPSQEVSKKATNEPQRSRKRTTLHNNIRLRKTNTTSIEQVPASSQDHWQSPLQKCCPSGHGAVRNENCDNGCLIARIKTKRTRFSISTHS